MILTAVGVIAAWVVWMGYQFIRWSDAAELLAERQVDILNQMSFKLLANRAGQGHEIRSEVIDGHLFLIGWQADRPGHFGMLARDPSAERVALERPEQGENADELELRGFVDFLYPLVLTKQLHFGLAFRLTRRSEDAGE